MDVHTHAHTHTHTHTHICTISTCNDTHCCILHEAKPPPSAPSSRRTRRRQVLRIGRQLPPPSPPPTFPSSVSQTRRSSQSPKKMQKVKWAEPSFSSSAARQTLGLPEVIGTRTRRLSRRIYEARRGGHRSLPDFTDKPAEYLEKNPPNSPASVSVQLHLQKQRATG